MVTNLDYINQICIDLGGTGGHVTNVSGENEICTLLGGTGGHSLEINALNEICTLQGVTAGHSLNLAALNAIGEATYVNNLAAWAAIQSSAVLRRFPEKIDTITFTSVQGASLVSVDFDIVGSSLTVDWGDGSAVENVLYNSSYQHFSHNYATANTTYTITIAGDVNKLIKFRTVDTKINLHFDISQFTKCAALTAWEQSGTTGVDGYISGSITNFKDTQLTTLNVVTPHSSISGSVTDINTLTSIVIAAPNTVTGSLSGKKMTWIRLALNTTNAGVTGDVSTMSDLIILRTSDNAALSGDITNLTKLQRIWLSGTCSCSGTVTNMLDLTELQISTTTATVTGDVTLLTKLTSIDTTKGISGSVTNLTLLTYLRAVSGGTAITIGGSITNCTALTYINVWGNNTLSGSITNLTGLTYLDNQSNSAAITGSISNKPLTRISVLGNCSLSGDVGTLDPTKMVYLAQTCSNTLSGDISALVNLTQLHLYPGNTCTGSISSLTKLTQLWLYENSNIGGSFNALTLLQQLYVRGTTTISGDLSLLPSLTNCYLAGGNRVVDYTSGKTWANNQKQVQILPGTGYGLSATEVDNLLIDLANVTTWAAPKSIVLSSPNAARTSASDTARTTLIGKGVSVTTA